MKVLFIILGVALTSHILGSIVSSPKSVELNTGPLKIPGVVSPENQLKNDAFQVLDTKCNICHLRQNPFMIFKPKNMEKRANLIHEMVFVQRRMPKGDDIKLTKNEYGLLEDWLKTQLND